VAVENSVGEPKISLFITKMKGVLELSKKVSEI
jgi:hypothetical protein